MRDVADQLGARPRHEPFRSVLLRNVTIALLVGVVVAMLNGGFRRLPFAILLALWPSFGGHYIEEFYLRWLRLRVPHPRVPVIQAVTRLATWFVGGTILATGMHWTATALGGPWPMRWPWWVGGAGFIGIELIVHLILLIRGRPNFYSGIAAH